MLGISAAARILEVSEETVRRWADEGIIKGRRDSGNRRQFSNAEVERVRKLRIKQEEAA